MNTKQIFFLSEFFATHPRISSSLIFFLPLPHRLLVLPFEAEQIAKLSILLYNVLKNLGNEYYNNLNLWNA